MAEIRDYLKEVIMALKKSQNNLIYTYEKCQKLPISEKMSMEDMDDYEALCSKFSRLSDLIIKKVIRVIDLVEFENPDKTVIDTIGSMAKRGFVDNEKEFYAIREIRNTIAHEYMLGSLDLLELYRSVITHYPVLLKYSGRILSYVDEKKLV